jgi:hypothetical protein
MDIDIEQLASLLIAISGLAAAVFTGKRYLTIKAQFIETIGDIADFLALIYAASKNGTCNDPETLKMIISKTEEIWTDLQALGPAVEAILAQKSSLADAIGQATTKKEGS